MSREIEVKARVKNFDQIIAKLKNLGCEMTAPIKQDDVILVQKNFGDFTKLHIGGNILRIRIVNDIKSSFTLKQSGQNELDCIEKQTDIAKPQEMLDALKMMGYEPVVEVHKKRIKIKYQNYTICLDQVESLGDYIEVEEMFEDDAQADGIQEEIFKFLKTLGVEEQDRETHGYDTLMYLKMHKNK